MPHPRSHALTADRTIRHEALRPRIETLLGQVAAVAKTKPDQAAAPVVVALAADLLFEAREFRPRGERRGLPAVAPDLAGLAAQLGQALAMLDLWTARHAPSARAVHRSVEGEDMGALRRKLALRIERHNEGIFEAGRRAGMAEKASLDQADDKLIPAPAGAHRLGLTCPHGTDRDERL